MCNGRPLCWAVFSISLSTVSLHPTAGFSMFARTGKQGSGEEHKVPVIGCIMQLNCMSNGRCVLNVHRLGSSMYVCIRAFISCRFYSLNSHECAPISQTKKMSLACYRRGSLSMLDHEVMVAESSTALEHKQQSCVI